MLSSTNFYPTQEEAIAQPDQYFQPPEEEDADTEGVLRVLHKVELKTEDGEYLQARAANIVNKIPGIDTKPNEVAAGWKTEHMGKVEPMIPRLTFFEMAYDGTIPEKVSTNGAVELAKKFGGNDSPASVNGILARFIGKENREQAQHMTSVYAVTQVTTYIRNMFTQNFTLNRISIKDEVSNCKYHTSGYIYFAPKDGGSQIIAVMFAGQRKGLTFELEEGQEATVTDSVDVYKRDDRYQLYTKETTRKGRGDLFARFEKLCNELEDMGMFDSCYKQPIPKYALKVGIVTASTGATVRDTMNTSARRNSYVQLILCPAPVQGKRTKFSVVKGVGTLDCVGLDVIIVGRGGGSIGDLWAFNEGMMARAMSDSATPIISAIGRRTDVIIADYMAGLRAPTPSTAAELTVFDLSQLEEWVKLYSQALNRSMEWKVEKLTFRPEQGKMRLTLHSLERRLVGRGQRLANIESQMERITKERLRSDKRHLTGIEERLSFLIEGSLKAGKHRLALGARRLEALSPLKKLGTGYGFVTDTRGNAVRTIAQTRPGDIIGISVRDGRIKVQVKHVFGNEG